MHIAGGHHRDVQFLAELDNSAIVIAQLLFALRSSLAQHEQVIADRLNLQIVVKPRDLLELVPRSTGYHGAEQLARFARRTDHQPFAQLGQLRFRDPRPLVEIIEVGLGNQLVQILEPDLVFNQNDLVIGRNFFRIAARQRGIKL